MTKPFSDHDISDHDIEALYQETADEEPSPQLDERILAHAASCVENQSLDNPLSSDLERQPSKRSWHRDWRPILGVAASVALVTVIAPWEWQDKAMPEAEGILQKSQVNTLEMNSIQAESSQLFYGPANIDHEAIKQKTPESVVHENIGHGNIGHENIGHENIDHESTVHENIATESIRREKVGHASRDSKIQLESVSSSIESYSAPSDSLKVPAVKRQMDASAPRQPQQPHTVSHRGITEQTAQKIAEIEQLVAEGKQELALKTLQELIEQDPKVVQSLPEALQALLPEANVNSDVED